MARLKDLTLLQEVFMRVYRYRSFDWSPGRRLEKPLSAAKFALITTAGLHLHSQAAFDDDLRGGDVSFRELPENLNLAHLRIAHRSTAFDQSGAGKDLNLVFPLHRFQELAADGTLGGLNHRHFSFMGSITAPGRLISQTAPDVADLLRKDQVDAVFLIPV